MGLLLCLLAGLGSRMLAAVVSPEEPTADHTPLPAELLASHNWAQRIGAAAGSTQAVACLKLLHEDVPDQVTRGRSWRGPAFQHGDRIYSHGVAFNATKHLLVQYLKIRPLYYGDYYPLTGYSQATDLWMAYELNLPETGQALIVALRRPDSPYETARFVLRGLEEGASYQVTNLDTGEQVVATGQQLLREGLEVRLKTRPGSAMFRVERKS